MQQGYINELGQLVKELLEIRNLGHVAQGQILLVAGTPQIEIYANLICHRFAKSA